MPRLNFKITSLGFCLSGFALLALPPSQGALLASPTAAGDSLLTAYVSEALQNHPDLTSMQAMIDAESSRARMASSWMNPDLMVGVMNLPTSLDFHEEAMTSVEFGFMLRIPFPGKLKSAGQAQSARVDAAQSNYGQMRLDMTAMVKMAYYELAGDLAVRSALEEGARLSDDIVAAAEIMSSSGLGTQADIFRARLERDRWQQRLIQNEQAIATARSRLAAALGRTSDEDIHPPHTLREPGELPAAVQILEELGQPPSLKAQEAQIESARRSLANARLQYWPDVELGFSYGWRDYLKAGSMAGDPEMNLPLEDMISIEARIPLPLFAGGNQRAGIQERQAMLRSAEAEYESAALKLRDAVRQAHARAEAAKESYDLIAHSLLPDAQATFDASLADYQSGRLPYMSLNEALMQVVMQRMDRAMTLADVFMAVADLERLTGKPLISP